MFGLGSEASAVMGATSGCSASTLPMKSLKPQGGAWGLEFIRALGLGQGLGHDVQEPGAPNPKAGNFGFQVSFHGGAAMGSASLLQNDGKVFGLQGLGT